LDTFKPRPLLSLTGQARELAIEESIGKIEDSRSLKKKEVKIKPFFFLVFLYLYRGGSTKLSKPTKPKLLKEGKKKNDKQVTRSRNYNILVNSVQKRGAKTHKHHSSSSAVVLCYVNQNHISPSFFSLKILKEREEIKR
jgi:hypothetical protein